MTQNTVTPMQALLGGASISISVSLLLLANGSTFGISGFLHRSLRKHASLEDRLAVLGLLIGGICIGFVEEYYNNVSDPSAAMLLAGGSWGRAAITGFLVGTGSRVSEPPL